MSAGLSKSKIAAFEQCPKRLWLATHRPDLAQFDEAVAARFATGHAVGAAACALVPAGVMVEAIPDLATAERRTRELLDDGNTTAIFEATLSVDGVLVRIDILEADGAGGWRIAEVKSTTSAKDVHRHDLATQVWVARCAGLALSGASIRHLNRDFVLEREGEYQGVFADAELLEMISDIIAGRPEIIASAKATLSGTEPYREVGAHCEDPYPCEFSSYCQAAMPPGPDWPVTILPNGGGKRWLAGGVVDLLAVDAEKLTNATHAKVHKATVTGEPFHDRDGAEAVIEQWTYPRTWLDFETIQFALPRWVGTRPYDQIPFQFSAHIENADGQIEHREFLSLDGSDPRRPCAEALVDMIPTEGAIIAYNAPFERGCITRLADQFADLAPELRSIALRLVDLLPVTRATWYHRDQRGSWSIKAVLPTVAPHLDYKDLQVRDGGNAQAAYLEAITEGASQERIAELDTALKLYCGRDTEAMMVLARRLIARA